MNNLDQYKKFTLIKGTLFLVRKKTVTFKMKIKNFNHPDSLNYLYVIHLIFLMVYFYFTLHSMLLYIFSVFNLNSDAGYLKFLLSRYIVIFSSADNFYRALSSFMYVRFLRLELGHFCHK